MANPHLKDIVSTSRYEIEPTNKYKKKRYLDNTNKFMNEAFSNSVGTQRADLGEFKKFALNSNPTTTTWLTNQLRRS